MGRMEKSPLDCCAQSDFLWGWGWGGLALGVRVRASNRAWDMGVLISLQGWARRGWNLGGSGIRKEFLGQWDPSYTHLTPIFFHAASRCPPSPRYVVAWGQVHAWWSPGWWGGARPLTDAPGFSCWG